MRPPFYRSIVRLGVRPDEPGAVAGPRRRGSRRPHADAAVAAVRRLIELAAMGRRRRRNTPGGSGQKPNEPARPIMQLCAADVDLHCAPRSAVEDFLANREPPREEPGPRRRSRRSKRDEHHAWLLERER